MVKAVSQNAADSEQFVRATVFLICFLIREVVLSLARIWFSAQMHAARWKEHTVH